MYAVCVCVCVCSEQERGFKTAQLEFRHWVIQSSQEVRVRVRVRGRVRVTCLSARAGKRQQARMQGLEAGSQASMVWWRERRVVWWREARTSTTNRFRFFALLWSFVRGMSHLCAVSSARKCVVRIDRVRAGVSFGSSASANNKHCMHRRIRVHLSQTILHCVSHHGDVDVLSLDRLCFFFYYFLFFRRSL